MIVNVRPTLGVQSFVNNGVRSSIIPLLIKYFQDRRMIVKWHGVESTERTLNGGGPQGALWGILEYLSQSNGNTDFISRRNKFKFIDDLSILEKINILSIGISSYNFKMHVASDIPTNGYFIQNTNLETQDNLNKICEWTSANKMKINKKKSNGMIFNFTNNYQFSSRITIEDEVIDTIRETKLLGVMVNDKLDWTSNTSFLVKRSNSRMRLLHKLVDFSVPLEDLVTIYIQYIRSILEQSCQVWHSSLTLENFQDLERVQKNAMKILLQDDYLSYSNALLITGLSTLFERRQHLSLKFAKACVRNKQTKHMFPINPVSPDDHHTRFKEQYDVTKPGQKD